ncbi:hypothetical protein ACL9RJ_10490 [Pseudomonas sp. Mn2068]|uniref:hypothetical protein n=1 Tax=Pseudomonas sp. Mn2068 TaxID=3395265 RepID=UPI003BE95580
MTDQNNNTTDQVPTHLERFAEACKRESLERHPSAAVHTAYTANITSGGQRHCVDGPFFTHEEAAISAEILRKSCRNARATSAFYQDHPAITPQLTKDCQANRAGLAKQLNIA